jgi:hypothetical protein
VISNFYLYKRLNLCCIYQIFPVLHNHCWRNLFQITLLVFLLDHL